MKKIIWILLLLSLVFISGCITGNTIKVKETTINVEPTVVNRGEQGLIFLDPGKYGSDNLAHFYKARGFKQERELINSLKLCSKSCLNQVNRVYTIPTSWEPGRYVVRILDIGTEEYARAYFEVF